MAFELPPLPYDRTALEPHISGETLDYHHGKHHNTYVNTLNDMVAGTEHENASLEDVMVTKLLAVNEQEPEYGSVLEVARALREQIDWDDVRERTKESPFAKAFFTLLEELGVLPAR